MANNTVTFKSIDFSRLVDLHDDTEKPYPAYEFSGDKTLHVRPPKTDYTQNPRKYIREENL